MKNIFTVIRIGALAVVAYLVAKRGTRFLGRTGGGTRDPRNLRNDFANALKSTGGSRGELIMAAKRFGSKLPVGELETTLRDHLLATGTPERRAETDARDIRWGMTG